MPQADDERWMRRALELAERGRGYVEPNPLVGAVIVSEGKGVGEGWHHKFGEPHAEIIALQAAGDRAQNAELYVTLEPCCHHGKTPPCTNAAVKSGIRRVVAAMLDPFAQVSGQGIEQLVAAGINVEIGVCEIEARNLNRPYLTLIEKGRPYVHLKWAMTLDGKMATASGESKWISNKASQAVGHQLRGRMDAIIVGARTVRADDPLLTARPPGPRTPSRIVLSSKPELPVSCQLLRTAQEAPVIVAAKERGSIAGAEVIVAFTVDELMAELSRRRMTNVLVEGGAKVLGSFLDAGLVDEVHVFVAPLMVGGETALSPMGGVGTKQIVDSLRLERWEVRMIESDIYIHGWKEPRTK